MSESAFPANRLSKESSPYLLLHAHNPVDWFPWGPEAIERARREDKPIFLSVGYSTCYWCHVMERESFSDPAIAARMNERFVNVKVDREERPDLDEVYMLATQMLSGQGGWPNSVFLTPALEPFFAGTYFPPEDRWGRPGFPTVLESLAHAWRERRADVEAQAAELGGAIRRHLDEIEPWSGELPGAELAARAADGLRKRFDATHGGFGEAPKFPTPANLWLLAELAEDPINARADAAMMLAATLDAMARGGIFDQVAGGFHRYATDRAWKVPHFEKMLYDNGLLLEAYAREHARTGDAEAARVAAATAEFLARELTGPSGALWSALDAEVAGHEGGHHVWTREQLDRALGAEDAAFLAPVLGFDGEPFFEESYYVLHLPRPLDVVARQRRTTREALLAEVEPLLAKLAAARAARPRPATDDKVLADWNGTAIAGLAAAGRALARPDLVDRAARAAEAVLRDLRAPDGTLLHAWRAGAGRVHAFLADYAFLIHGLLRLHEASGDRRWIGEAIRLEAEMGRRLGSPRGGYFNAEESEDLLVRGKELFDGALPAANAVAALVAIDLAAATGDRRHLDSAESTLRAFAPVVATHPDGARTMTIAFARLARARGRSASGPATPAPVAAAPASAGARAIASIAATLGAAGADGFRALRVDVALTAGWSIAAQPEPPTVEVEGGELRAVALPGATPLPGLPGSPGLTGWTERLQVEAELRPDAPRPELRLRFHACGEGACHPPATVAIPLGR
jgi:hypothetical protein